MELSPGDIFDAETDKVPENVTAELQRQNYFPRQCELVTESEDLVISTAEEFYSLKLAGDHAYLVRDYIKAVELYEKYLRNVFFKYKLWEGGILLSKHTLAQHNETRV